MEIVSVFDEATRDHEAEAHQAALTVAVSEAESVWAFLSLAKSQEEYSHRLALSEDHLTTIAKRHGVSYEDLAAPLERGFTIALAAKHGGSCVICGSNTSGRDDQTDPYPHECVTQEQQDREFSKEARIPGEGVKCSNCGHADPNHDQGAPCRCGCTTFQPQQRNASKTAWKHDPQRDGSGCTSCGSYAQVDSDNMCRDCSDAEDVKESKTAAKVVNADTHTFGQWGCNDCGMDKPDAGDDWVPTCQTVREGFGDHLGSKTAGEGEIMPPGSVRVHHRPDKSGRFDVHQVWDPVSAYIIHRGYDSEEAHRKGQAAVEDAHGRGYTDAKLYPSAPGHDRYDDQDYGPRNYRDASRKMAAPSSSGTPWQTAHNGNPAQRKGSDGLYYDYDGEPYSQECTDGYGVGCDGTDCSCRCHSENAPFFNSNEDVAKWHGKGEEWDDNKQASRRTASDDHASGFGDTRSQTAPYGQHPYPEGESEDGGDPTQAVEGGWGTGMGTDLERGAARTGPTIDDPDGYEYTPAPDHVQKLMRQRFEGGGVTGVHPTEPNTYLHGIGNWWDGPHTVKDNGDGSYSFTNPYDNRTDHFDEHGPYMSPEERGTEAHKPWSYYRDDHWSKESSVSPAEVDRRYASIHQALMDGQDPLAWVAEQNPPGGPQYALVPGGHDTGQEFSGTNPVALTQAMEGQGGTGSPEQPGGHSDTQEGVEQPAAQDRVQQGGTGTPEQPGGHRDKQATRHTASLGLAGMSHNEERIFHLPQHADDPSKHFTVQYFSEQAKGDDGQDAPGFTRGTYMVKHPLRGGGTKFFDHTPHGPGLSGAKPYAAENAERFITNNLRQMRDWDKHASRAPEPPPFS